MRRDEGRRQDRILSVSRVGRIITGLVHAAVARQPVPVTTTAHTLRHTFATRYRAAHPGDFVGVATLRGHRSLSTTRISVQPTAETLAERVARLDLNPNAG